MRTFIVIVVIIVVLIIWISLMPTNSADIYNKKESLHVEEEK